MASYRAVSAISEAVINLLSSHFRFEDFNNQLEFRIYQAQDFSRAMEAGISLFLYRILPNGTHRTPTGRLGPNGRRYNTRLPVDLHFILTAWGRDASLQHTIAGWMMQILEDTPILPSGLLNAVAPDVFQPDETVEIVLAELTNEDLLRLWDTLVQNVYQLSVPYVARNVWIESGREQTAGGLIENRIVDYARIERGDTAQY